jgi:hypothetical protein
MLGIAVYVVLGRAVGSNACPLHLRVIGFRFQAMQMDKANRSATAPFLLVLVFVVGSASLGAEIAAARLLVV